MISKAIEALEYRKRDYETILSKLRDLTTDEQIDLLASIYDKQTDTIYTLRKNMGPVPSEPAPWRYRYLTREQQKLLTIIGRVERYLEDLEPATEVLQLVDWLNKSQLFLKYLKEKKGISIDSLSDIEISESMEEMDRGLRKLVDFYENILYSLRQEVVSTASK